MPKLEERPKDLNAAGRDKRGGADWRAATSPLMIRGRSSGRKRARSASASPAMAPTTFACTREFPKERDIGTDKNRSESALAGNLESDTQTQSFLTGQGLHRLASRESTTTDHSSAPTAPVDAGTLASGAASLHDLAACQLAAAVVRMSTRPAFSFWSAARWSGKSPGGRRSSAGLR